MSRIKSGTFIVRWAEFTIDALSYFTLFNLATMVFKETFRFVDAWVLLLCALSVAAFILSFDVREPAFQYAVLVLLALRVWEFVPYALRVAIFTKPNKGDSDIHDPRRTVILLLLNYVEMIFWFAACYSIAEANGWLQVEEPKAIVLLRESLISMVANSSGAFKLATKWVWFAMLAQNALGLLMTVVVATRFLSFLRPPKVPRNE